MAAKTKTQGIQLPQGQGIQKIIGAFIGFVAGMLTAFILAMFGLVTKENLLTLTAIFAVLLAGLGATYVMLQNVP